MKLKKFIVLDDRGRRAEVFACDGEQAARAWKYGNPDGKALSVEPARPGENPRPSRAQ